MVKTQTNVLEDLFNARVHLGHKRNRIHPKAMRYVYKMDSGTSIIDLTQTAEKLEKAKEFLIKLGKDNKTILVISTKKITSTFVLSLSQQNNLAYIILKWPAGLLTNFKTIMENVKKLKTMKENREKGEWNKLVKHEQTALSKELVKLERIYGGLISLEKLPDAIVTLDIKKEKNAVKEAKSMGIPVIAIVDTNVNPDLVDYGIPGNDDSESSVSYLMTELITAYVKGKTNQ